MEWVEIAVAVATFGISATTLYHVLKLEEFQDKRRKE